MSPLPRILVLEDDPSHTELILRAFEHAGAVFEVSTASNVAGARRAVQERRPDLVIADLRLPDGSGVDLLEPSKDGPRLAVVVMTSHGDEQAAVAAMKAGALDYVVKSDRALATMPSTAQRALGQWSQIIERRRAEQELRESERRLNEAQSAAHIGSWELDMRNMSVWRSMEVYRIYGLDPAHAPADLESMLDPLLPMDRPPVRAMLDRVSRSGEPHEVTCRIRRGDGEVRVLHAMAKLEAGGDGKPARVVGTVQDVTEREQLEQQLLHAQKMEAIGRLASGVAHDFNNLLMGIIGCADMALDKMDAAAPARRYVSELRTAAVSGAGTVSSLLSFSRKRDRDIDDIVVDDTIRKNENLLRSLIGEDVELRLEPGASGCTRVAPGQIEQVLFNLASNARDAMPEGGALTITTSEITVGHGERLQAHVGLRPGPYISVSVTDTGCGMDPDTQATALEPFVTTKPVGKGTGLGLSTVYGIVHHAGGHVELESEPGAGTTVRLYLPRFDPPPAAVEAAPEEVAHRGNGETILVLEDEALVRMAVRYHLEGNGYRVLCASEGTEALALLDRHGSGIDLLLTDIVLPGGMRGTQVADEIVARTPGTPAIFVSAYPPEMLPATGRVAPEAILTKPVPPETLLSAVRRALDAARDRQPPPSSNGSLVLLVEDHAVSRMVCREALEELGCEVVDTGDPREALEMLRAWAGALSLVLTDFNLPGTTGADLAAELWKARPEIPVVYISGRSPEDSDELRRALESPRTSFLAKPIGLTELLTHVEERLPRRAPER